MLVPHSFKETYMPRFTRGPAIAIAIIAAAITVLGAFNVANAQERTIKFATQAVRCGEEDPHRRGAGGGRV